MGGVRGKGRGKSCERRCRNKRRQGMGTFWEELGKKVLKEQNKDELNGVSCFEQCDHLGIYC